VPGSLPHGQRYRFVFRGESELLASTFPEFTREFEGANTALVGTIVDQAHLLGLVDRADSLGFVLLSVNPLGPSEARDEDRDRDA
jgi:hypothetical protein